MKGVVCGKDLVLTSELLQTVTSNQLDRRLVCLGAAVAEENPLGKRMVAKLTRQLRLRQDVVQIRNVQQLFRLLPNRPDDSRMAVTQIVYRDSSQKVEVLFAIGIPDPGAFSPN